jgi:hypothetical protein
VLSSFIFSSVTILGRDFILESEKPWKDMPHSHYLHGAIPDNHHQQFQFMSSPTTNIPLVSSMVAHTTPRDTILDPYHSSSTGTFSSHPILNIQDADYFSALSRNPGSTLATSPGRGASHPILNIQDADYFSALSVNPGSTLATSPGRGTSSFPTLVPEISGCTRSPKPQRILFRRPVFA